MEVVFTLQAMCVGREGELYTRTLAHSPRLASPGRAWRGEIRLLTFRGHGFLLLFYFLVTCALSLRDMEI